jgi:hypothetical protein
VKLTSNLYKIEFGRVFGFGSDLVCGFGSDLVCGFSCIFDLLEKFTYS